MLYNLKDQRIHISRSVTFVDSEFPFGKNYKGHKVIANKHLVDALNKIQVNDDSFTSYPDESPPTSDPLTIKANTLEKEKEYSKNDMLEQTRNRQSTYVRFKPKHLEDFVTDLPHRSTSESPSLLHALRL